MVKKRYTRRRSGIGLRVAGKLALHCRRTSCRRHFTGPTAGKNLGPEKNGCKEGGLYGWPFAYFGPNEDPRRKGERPDSVKQTLVPDVPLAPHSASLGLAFYDGKAFPEKYRNEAFIGQHSSWNRSQFSGYKVVFVPFKNGKPTGKPEDFLTDFLTGNEEEVYGRPVGVAVLKDGSMPVADDASNTIWRVSANR
jgi:glucose/arabinose dehydrogenase